MHSEVRMLKHLLKCHAAVLQYIVNADFGLWQVIKVYPGGKMSQHIASLKEGSPLECKGPIPKLDYKPNMKKKIGMVRLGDFGPGACC